MQFLTLRCSFELEKRSKGVHENLQPSETCAIKTDMTVKKHDYGTYNNLNQTFKFIRMTVLIIRGVTSSRPAGWRGR